jgi:ATP-dependent helicase/nuclease subunit B
MNDITGTGLSLVLGPANSGKLGRVLQWWEERQERKPLIVVPTMPDARSLSVEMAQRRGALVGQSPATTFDGLVRELLGRSPKYVGAFERSLIVSHLLREEPPRAPGFSARFPGMAGVVSTLLQQLGDSGRSSEEISRLLDRWASVDAGSAALAGDIERLLNGYAVLRDRLGLSDRSGAMREALAAAERWSRPLALYGFTSFTFAQRRLVEALAGVAEVLLVLDYESSRGRGLTNRSEFADWAELAGPRVEELPAQSAYMSRSVAFLERHFMGDAPSDDPPLAWEGGEAGGVRFLLASGQRNEAELAAQEVAGLIRDGVSPGDIGVIVRSTKTWGTLLEDVFSSCAIPCEVDEREALGETGLGHAFLAGVRGVAADDTDAVLDYLRGPFSALTLEQAADVELDYLSGTTRGVRALAQGAGGVAERALGHLAGVVARRDGEVFVDLDAARRATAHMLENCLMGFAAAVGDPACPRTATEDAGSDARAARALDGALLELAAFREEDALPEGLLRMDVLLPALGRLAVAGGPSGSGGAVQVLTAHRARARRFQAVLVLGLVEGEFPRRGGAPALLTAAQRARLEAIGGALFPPDVDEEEALFVRAMSRASTFLFLSARDADDAGGYAGQSYYWSHCKSLLCVGDGEVVRRTLADQVYRPEQAPSLRQYLRTCASGRLAPHDACGIDSFRPPAWRRRGGLAGLESPQVLAELAAVGCFSPSALESYLSCPFAWFVERVIGAEDMETLVDNRLAGDLLHQVLRDTLRELSAREALPLREEHLGLANSVAAGLIQRAVQSDECPGTAAERRVVEWRVKRWAAEVFRMEVAADSVLLAAETELAVGGTDGVDVDGLCLKGRIDRVDHSPAGDVFIVDYKSGELASKNKIGTKGALQLPLYMLALGAERPDVRVMGGAYLSPKEGKRSGIVAAGCEDLLGSVGDTCAVTDEDAFRELLDRSLDLAKKAAGGIRRGDIAPLAGRTCPGWCRLGSLCRAKKGSGRW